MTNRQREFDLVLWGATGFTGQLVAEYLASRYGSASLCWAIAGRDRTKLKRLRQKLQASVDINRDLPLLTGDAHDPKRLQSIARRTKVICSTVGPYAEYGTPLVHACVREDTDYCDLTGEAHWMRRMMDRFHDRAEDQGTRIVHACGFDAVPSDLGTLMVQDRALDAYGAPCDNVSVLVSAEGGSVSGGTVASMIQMFEAAGRDRRIQHLLDNPYGLVPGRSEAGVANDADGSEVERDWGTTWTMPFPMEMINRKVVHRSNFLLGHPWTRSFKYGESVPLGEGVAGAVACAIGITGLQLLELGLTQAPVRAFLKHFVLPEPGAGPDRSSIRNGSFRMTLMGTGQRKGHGSDFRVNGTITSNLDPGYGSTARMLGEAAVCLAHDEVESPVPGGVLTPSAGIGTPLIDRLRDAGMSWTVSCTADQRQE